MDSRTGIAKVSVFHRELYCVKCAGRFSSQLTPRIYPCKHVVCSICYKSTKCPICGFQEEQRQDETLIQRIQQMGDLYIMCERADLSPGQIYHYSQQVFLLLHEVPQELNSYGVTCRRGTACSLIGCVYVHPGRLPKRIQPNSPQLQNHYGDSLPPSIRSTGSSIPLESESTELLEITPDTCTRCEEKVDFLPFCVHCGLPIEATSAYSVFEPLRARLEVDHR